jgi:hypothetical protein
MKTKYAVLIGLIVASSLGGAGYVIHESAFEAGKKDNDKEWKLKWSERDKADKDAQLTQEQAQREEELRRKKKTEEIVNDAEREKQKALADAADADNAADQLRGQLAKSGVNSQPVKQAGFPQMPPEGRQPPKPQVCLPTCTKNQTVAREKSLSMLTQQPVPERLRTHIRRSNAIC